MFLPSEFKEDIENSISVDKSYDHKMVVLEEESRVQKSFIRKVLGILFLQFIVSTATTSAVLLTPIARFYVNENSWLVNLFLIIYIALLGMLILERKKSFTNCILLICFSCCEAFFLATLAVVYDLLSVLIALVLIVFALLVMIILTFLVQQYKLKVAGLLSITTVLIGAECIQVILGTTAVEAMSSLFFCFPFVLYVVCYTRKLMQKSFRNEHLLGAICLRVEMFYIHTFLIKIWNEFGTSNKFQRTVPKESS